MMKYLFAALFTFFYFSLSAGNSHITVRGRVCDDTGRPVCGVQVTDGRTIAVTDKRGGYELRTSDLADYVYYSLPSGYEHRKYDRCVPVFYKAIDKNRADQKIDFVLDRSSRDQARHTFVVWADPLVLLKEEFSQLEEVVADLKQTIGGYDTPVIAMSAGDNVFDRPNLIEDYKNSIAPLDIPFYHVIGNHDMDYNERSNELSDSTYCRNFGPSHYSFNVGKVHYVVLKDVFYYGDSYHYIGYVTEEQLSWLEKDLASVEKGSTVIVGLHIPTRYGDSPSAEGVTLMRNSVMNNQALYRVLDGYNVHIMAGHSHIQWNTLVSEHIFEHTHGAASGAWWQGEVGLDGNPKGYTVYEIDGSDVKWYFKGVGHDRNEQFKIYTEGLNVIANVYNYDPAWKVELYEGNKYVGEMEQYWGVDPYAEGLYPPGGNKLHGWLSYGKTSHLFRGTISDPASEIKVVVTDRFGARYEKIVKGWSLVWSDEFDYEGLPDPTKWSYDTDGNAYGWGNNEAQHYTEADADNVCVSDGTLKITARREPIEGKEYSSARLITKGKGDWLYGKVDVRAKLPTGKGTWPAIWMLPTDWEYGQWPDSGEIDIMENVGYEPEEIVSTAHCKKYNHMIGTQFSGRIDVADCFSEFHNYTLEWDEYSWRAYVDGKLIYTFRNDGKGFEGWPFDKRFHLLLNLAIGGNWGGKMGIDPTGFPKVFEIDYVRVYQR